MIVVVDPVPDHEPGFGRGYEDFVVEFLGAELVVPGLDVGVLPGRGGLDEPGLEAESGQPNRDGLGDELGAVVGADPGLKAVKPKQLARWSTTVISGGMAKRESSSSTLSMRSLDPSARRMLMKS